MNRPLVICDCDEVILHMVAPFRTWLADAHGVAFEIGAKDFARAMRRDGSDTPMEPEEIWALLGGFFDSQMGAQEPIEGSIAALTELAQIADVVILTNLQDHRQDARIAQLAAHGLPFRVFTNQGPKGPALRAILDEYEPPKAVFIDDLPQHHDSVAQAAPDVLRLHFCGEPLLAPNIDCAYEAGHAHARIDNWAQALPWLKAHLTKETAA